MDHTSHKSQFVRYKVIVSRKVPAPTKADSKHTITEFETVRGIVRDTAAKLGNIFRQNPDIIHFTHLESESYDPIFC